MDNTLTSIVLKNSVQPLDESTQTGDIGVSPAFIGKLIKQTYAKSILPLITSVIPLTKPMGYTYSLQAYYSGLDNVSSSINSMKIIELNTPFVGNIGDILTFTDNIVSVDVVVEYYESLNNPDRDYILVNIVSNPLVPLAQGMHTTDNTYSIDSVFSSRLAVKKILQNYSKATEYSTINTVKINSIRTPIEAQTRKLKSVITKEAVQDINSQYGEKAEDMIAEILSEEMALEMDKEVIDYMRSIANHTSDLLINSTADGDTVYAISMLTLRINKEMLALSRKHGRNIRGFIVISPELAALLISAGTMAFGKSGNLDVQMLTENNNHLGRMMQYIDVIVDKYAVENYCLVGWKEDVMGSAGVIFSPYSMGNYFTADPESGKEIIVSLNRYAYTRNAFDESTTGSDYFTTFNVDLSGLNNY